MLAEGEEKGALGGLCSLQPARHSGVAPCRRAQIGPRERAAVPHDQAKALGPLAAGPSDPSIAVEELHGLRSQTKSAAHRPR